MIQIFILYLIKINILMGGNAFQNLEKLTSEEYNNIMNKIKIILQQICHKIQPYIPLPQKQIHGDIDFLIILKEGKQAEDIRLLLQIQQERFKKNNNSTVNSVYFNKQVDFNIVKTPQQFDLCMFYKSYGGLGSFLGRFLHSRWVKLNQDGLICCQYFEHIKLEYLTCNSIEQILKFYGLDYQRYKQTFTTRNDLFEYLRQIRFLNQAQLITKQSKQQTKITKTFRQYIVKQGAKENTKCEVYEQPLQQTLAYFNKQKEFNQAWNAKLQDEKKKKINKNKWNGQHIMNIFKVDAKDLNTLKKKFQNRFKNRQQYEAYIQEKSFQTIVEDFGKMINQLKQQINKNL